MPGVPSGKGCEGCRKQKKKCDENKSSCSRCARLKIPCVGAGQQRYKFKKQNVAPNLIERSQRATVVIRSTFSPPPSNKSTVTMSMFIAALEVTDLKYSLGCYGDFLSQVPRHLGKSDALDASVRALVNTLPYHYNGRMPPAALISYVDALKALRVCLENKDTVLTAETLCAIYLIMICQGWIGRSDDILRSHGEILAHLMSSTIVQKWQGSFELDLLRTLCVPVLLEAIANPTICLNVWFLDLIDVCRYSKPINENQGIHISSLQVQKLARLPDLLSRPTVHLGEIKTAYRDMRADHPRVRRFLNDLGEEVFSGYAKNDIAYANKLRLFHQTQVVYGVLLTMILSLNNLLRVLDPGDFAMFEESTIFANDILVLAQLASQQRPLGASYIPPCLAAVWATTNDEQILSETERLIEEYQQDYPQTSWMEQAIWLKCLLESRRDQLFKMAFPVAGVGGGIIRRVSVCHTKASFGRHNKAAFGPSGSYLLS